MFYDDVINEAMMSSRKHLFLSAKARNYFNAKIEDIS